MDQRDYSSRNETPRSSGTAVGREIKDDAKHLKDKAATKASMKTQEAADRATSAARSTSSALSEASDTLERDDGVPNWLASAFKQAANSVADLAETVEGKEPREMIGEVDRFARDNPAAFLAGSAIAGFAAARIMKAGAQQSDASLDDVDPASNSSDSSGSSGLGTRSGPRATKGSFKSTTNAHSARTTPSISTPAGSTRTPGSTTGGA